MSKPQVTLTAEIVLQTPAFDDVELVHKWYNKPELAEYFRRFPPLEEWRLPAQTLQGLGLSFVIRENGQTVGLCQLVNYDANSKSLEVGLLLDNDLVTNRWNVSRQAYDQLCEYLFNGSGYEKLYMRVLTHRTKLVQRLCKDAWKLEGELRNSCRFQGHVVNEYYLGLLKEDFNALKGRP